MIHVKKTKQKDRPSKAVATTCGFAIWAPNSWPPTKTMNSFGTQTYVDNINSTGDTILQDHVVGEQTTWHLWEKKLAFTTAVCLTWSMKFKTSEDSKRRWNRWNLLLFFKGQWTVILNRTMVDFLMIFMAIVLIIYNIIILWNCWLVLFDHPGWFKMAGSGDKSIDARCFWVWSTLKKAISNTVNQTSTRIYIYI